ncbi:MAG: hypothetical protein RJA10_2254, partial [Pseudomonadota bacterium]
MADDTHQEPLKTGSDADNARKLQRAVDKLLSRPPAVSEGAVAVGGHGDPLRYEARVEFLPVLASGFDGVTAEPQAAVMTCSYLLKRDRGVERPVCFAFNGGPGSASL